MTASAGTYHSRCKGKRRLCYLHRTPPLRGWWRSKTLIHVVSNDVFSWNPKTCHFLFWRLLAEKAATKLLAEHGMTLDDVTSVNLTSFRAVPKLVPDNPCCTHKPMAPFNSMLEFRLIIQFSVVRKLMWTKFIFCQILESKHFIFRIFNSAC